MQKYFGKIKTTFWLLNQFYDIFGNKYRNKLVFEVFLLV